MERSEAEAIYDQGREVVVAVLLRMDEQIHRLEERVGRQDERIAQLERRLNRNSGNSSAPPSSDPPSNRPKRTRDPSGRGRGGQPGHEGRGRDLLACGGRARGELPDDVVASAFGPRLQAALVALSVRNRVSRRDLVELAEELFSARISTGAVEAILARASEALGVPHEDLLERVRAARALNVDETGWRTAGERRALWGAFTERHAFFQVAPDRHEKHAKGLLAHTGAIVTSDRWWAYAHLPLARRQLCWSHLKRDFAAHAEGLVAEKEFGEAGPRAVRARVLGLGDLLSHARAPRAETHRPPAAAPIQADHPLLRCKAGAQQALPRHGAQPPKGLAGAVDVRRPQGR